MKRYKSITVLGAAVFALSVMVTACKSPEDPLDLTVPVTLTITDKFSRYYYMTQSFQTDGLEVQAVYEDGSLVIVKSGYKLIWDDGGTSREIKEGNTEITKKAGTKTVRVEWQGQKSDPFDIAVIESGNTTKSIKNETEWNAVLASIGDSSHKPGTAALYEVYTLSIDADITVPGRTSSNANTSAEYVEIHLIGTNSITVGATSGAIIYTSKNQKWVIGDDTAGPTLQGKSGNNQALVYINSSTVELRNGTISDNTIGGGVYVNTGTFTMTGGTISGNTAGYIGNTGGGGVYVYNGTFTMSGGTISGNTTGTATGGGGGVFISLNGTLNKTGGTIYGNTTHTHTPGGNNNTAIYTSAYGHAVYWSNGGYYCDTTLGTTDSISTGTLPSSTGETNAAGNWIKK